MKLLLLIKKKYADYKQKRKNELRVKRFHIRNELIKYYLDVKRMYNVVDLPAHIYADKVMKQVLRTPIDVDRSYRKLLEYKKSVA